MNCFNHHEFSAVAQCIDCSKGLCNQCAKSFSFPICIECNTLRGNQEKQGAINELFWTFGLGIILTWFVSKVPGSPMASVDSTGSFVMMGGMFYAYSGLVAGWHTLNRITPRFFLFLPLIGWVIYVVIKMTLSMWVGLVMLPIRTVRNVKKIWH